MNKYLLTGLVGIVLWNGLSSQAWAQPPNCYPKNFSEATKATNSFQQGNVIVIGRVSDRPYVVVVPGESDKLLNLVRKCVSDAFLAQHKLGSYVYAGGFSKRQEAQYLSDLLRSHGLDARVVYFH